METKRILKKQDKLKRKQQDKMLARERKPSKAEEELEEPKQRRNSKASDKGEEVDAEDLATERDLKDAVKLDIV
jgi:hypothetical protein